MKKIIPIFAMMICIAGCNKSENVNKNEALSNFKAVPLEPERDYKMPKFTHEKKNEK